MLSFRNIFVRQGHRVSYVKLKAGGNFQPSQNLPFLTSGIRRHFWRCKVLRISCGASEFQGKKGPQGSGNHMSPELQGESFGGFRPGIKWLNNFRLIIWMPVSPLFREFVYINQHLTRPYAGRVGAKSEVKKPGWSVNKTMHVHTCEPLGNFWKLSAQSYQRLTRKY